MKPTFSLLAVSLLLSSCATIFTGTKDTLVINSQPEGARVFVNGLEEGRTPATLDVKRRFGETMIMLRLDGYQNRTFILGQEFNTVSIINLICLPCWAIDAATGAIKEYMPKGYDISLDPLIGYDIEDLPVREDGSIVVPYAEGSIALRSDGYELRIEVQE